MKDRTLPSQVTITLHEGRALDDVTYVREDIALQAIYEALGKSQQLEIPDKAIFV